MMVDCRSIMSTDTFKISIRPRFETLTALKGVRRILHGQAPQHFLCFENILFSF